MYVNYPRCPKCQLSMVRCKRYSSLIKKIQDKLENHSPSASTLTGSSTRALIFIRNAAMEGIQVPDQIAAIIKKNNDSDRRRKLTELFIHMIRLFQKLSGRTEIERDNLLKSIYEQVEKNNSIFFTRQQWLDLEREYNRLIFIDQFREKKESLGSDFEKLDVDTLNDLIFGPNPFSEFAYQICNMLMNQESGDGDGDDKWKSILLDKTTWNDFEKDRLMCDDKWIICPKGMRIIFLILK